jgi:transposase-like protein
MEATVNFASSFGKEHFGHATLGDKRLTERLVAVAGHLVRHPEGSFPDRFKNPADLDGFYNLMANPKVTHATVLAPHYERTLQAMRAQASVVLLLHDTTVLDYSGLTAIAELGQVGDGNGRGYYCHNSLAVTPQRQVLGLAHQILHTRRRAPKGESRAARRQRPDRESRLWQKASQAIPVAPAGQLWVDVADRGADVLEFLDHEVAAGKHFLVRSQHDRWVQIRLGEQWQRTKLHRHLRTLPAQGTRTVEVPPAPGRTARTAVVGVAWQELELLPPRQPRGEERGVPVRVVVLRVWELEPPPGVEALEWILLTNVAVACVADAFECVDWYACRWVIEEYHKAQKTGCAIERMQFSYADRLQPAIALLSVVATWLLQLRDASRDPVVQAEPAAKWVPASWLEVLALWRHGELQPDWTVRDFFMALARLGGHQNRKHDHPPGWIVLWRGWKELQTMTVGAATQRAKRSEET